MRTQRRTLPRAIASLECLDDRVLPSAAVAAHAVHAHAAVHTVSHANAHTAQVAHKAAKVSSSTFVYGGSSAATSNVTPAVSLPVTVSYQAPATTAAPSVSAGASTPQSPASSLTSALYVPSPTTTPTTTTPGVTTTVAETKTGPLAKAGQDLITIYNEYQANGGSGDFKSSLADRVEISGSNVGVIVSGNGGDINALASSLTSLGMQVQVVDAAHDSIQGLLPISQLANAAQNSQVLSLSAVYSPTLS